jgi:hypothetical protein
MLRDASGSPWSAADQLSCFAADISSGMLQAPSATRVTSCAASKAWRAPGDPWGAPSGHSRPTCVHEGAANHPERAPKALGSARTDHSGTTQDASNRTEHPSGHHPHVPHATSDLSNATNDPSDAMSRRWNVTAVLSIVPADPWNATCRLWLRTTLRSKALDRRPMASRRRSEARREPSWHPEARPQGARAPTQVPRARTWRAKVPS